MHHLPWFTSISMMKNGQLISSNDAPSAGGDGIFGTFEEMEKMKQDAMRKLRELLAGETQLKCPDNDAFLLKFLRARKYNVDSAFKNIKKYFKVRRNHPELFDELDPDFVLFDTVCRKHKLVTLSREKDAKGRAIIVLNLGTWNTDICKLDDFFRIGTAFVEHLLLDDEVQLKGVIFVMDFKNLGLYHSTQYTIPVIKRLFSLMQDCMPLRIKGFYVTNNPALFDILFAIAKHFMKTKLVRRTHLFGTDWNRLRSFIPDDVIPEEGGGRLETYDYDVMERDLKSRTEYFKEMRSWGYLDKPKE